jgi:hypothetical protein
MKTRFRVLRNEGHDGSGELKSALANDPRSSARTLAMSAGLCATLLLSGCEMTYRHISGVSALHLAAGSGEVSEVVATLDRAQLQVLVDKKENGMGHADFDTAVLAGTPFNHAGIGYNAQGHGPVGVNDIPHVDAHFYMIDSATREAITCDSEPTPAADQVPAGVEVKTGKPPFGNCIGAMGVHGSVPYAKLTAAMIYGYTGGKLAFLEPMIALDKLLAEEPMELEILVPDGLAPGTRYPRRFVMRYAPERFEFVLTDFVLAN